MYNYIYSEMLKLKKSKTVFILVLTSVIFPICWFILSLLMNSKQTWEAYVSENDDIIFMIIGTLVFIMLSSYVFLREYSENTIRVLSSYPVSRISVFISKVLAIYIVITLMYVLHFVLVFLGGLITVDEPLSAAFILLHIKANIISLILQFALVPLFIFLTNIVRNSTASALLAVFVLGTNCFAFMLGSFKSWPFMLPYLPLLNPYKPIDMGSAAILAVEVFAAGVLLSVLQFSRVEDL